MKALATAAALLTVLGSASPTAAGTDSEINTRAREMAVRCDGARPATDPACRGGRNRSRRLDLCQGREPAGVSARECDVLRRGAAGAAVARLRLNGKTTMAGDVGLEPPTR